MSDPDSGDVGLLKYQVIELQRALAAQAEEIRKIEERNARRDAEREASEKKWLVWGIMTVGGVAVTLFGVIWANLSEIIEASRKP